MCQTLASHTNEWRVRESSLIHVFTLCLLSSFMLLLTRTQEWMECMKQFINLRIFIPFFASFFSSVFFSLYSSYWVKANEGSNILGLLTSCFLFSLVTLPTSQKWVMFPYNLFIYEHIYWLFPASLTAFREWMKCTRTYSFTTFFSFYLMHFSLVRHRGWSTRQHIILQTILIACFSFCIPD